MIRRLLSLVLIAWLLGFVLFAVTLPQPAPAERTDASYAGETPDGKVTGTDMTLVFNNVAQCPALSVPSGWSSGGLPTGLQIVGHRFDDLTVLKVGAAVEKLRPWADRRPPI